MYYWYAGDCNFSYSGVVNTKEEAEKEIFSCTFAGDSPVTTDLLEVFPIALLNSPILTANGDYTMEDIELDTAKYLIKFSHDGFVSAIGHESTAQVLTTLLGIDVKANRITFEQQVGQSAIVFKLNGRPPEGKILSIEEINNIGFSFKLLRRVK